jgi:glutaconate CoA-transferase, subunit B
VSALADHLAATLAEEIAGSGVRVYAATSPLTVAAALAARGLGAPDLAIAGGFTRLDASPAPALTLGETGLLGDEPGPRGWASDVFTLLARGACGVAVTPAQLDARGRTNLSGIGPPGRPKVALPGSRGLPDNNASAGRVWLLLAGHSPRALVATVDVVSGAAPDVRSPRRLITEAGLFELTPAGWSAVWLREDGAELVAAAPDLGVRVAPGTPVRREPAPETLAALQAADPHRVRDVEVAGREEAGRLWAEHARREAEGA